MSEMTRDATREMVRAAGASAAGARTAMVARADLAQVTPYTTAPLDGITLDLRDNVNLWGAPPTAMAVLREIGADALATYPSVNATPLTASVAAQLGVRPDEVVAGNGSDDLIDACFRAVAAPGERVAHMEPSFSMVPRFARLNGLEPVGVPLRPDGAADIDGLLATGARVIYLCSPNNPTGTITPESEIRRCIAEAPGVVLLDEAYAEFVGLRDWRAEAPALGNVLIVRTFSKAWGLAGLRAGVGVGARDLVDAVVRARGPYAVNAVAERVATAALTQDAAWMRATAAAAVESRTRLDALVRGRRGVRAWDSRANFAFWQVEGDAETYAARFAAAGIAVRAFRALPGIGDALRVGVAPWERLAGIEAPIAACWP
jgi:histidinol-phosphate aminotransferase